MLSTLITNLLFLSPGSPKDHFTYYVQNCRPSKLLQKMMPGDNPGLIPKSMTAKADDVAGEIVLDGPTEEIADVRRYFKLFDIQPQYIKLSVSLISPIDHYRSDWQGAAANGRETSIFDGETGIGVSLQARVHGDGTITLIVQFTTNGIKQESRIRLKNGDSAEYMLHESGMKVEVPERNTLITFRKMSTGYAAVRLSAEEAN